MAKDPAFLFYSSDFLSGVSDLTMEERGQYITLLCIQHQKGGLTEKTIRLSVGSVSKDVLSKFEKSENGIFFNLRLKEESEKRAVFTESRRNNGKLGGRPKKPSGKPKENLVVNHMANHMEDENENDNIDINRDKNIKEQNFRKNASLFSAEYSKEMIQDFCDYWTESNPNGKKLLYETKRTFDIKRRLSTWSKNNFNKTNYDRGKKARIDKVQETRDFVFGEGEWAYKGEEE